MRVIGFTLIFHNLALFHIISDLPLMNTMGNAQASSHGPSASFHIESLYFFFWKLCPHFIQGTRLPAPPAHWTLPHSLLVSFLHYYADSLGYTRDHHHESEAPSVSLRPGVEYLPSTHFPFANTSLLSLASWHLESISAMLAIPT